MGDTEISVPSLFLSRCSASSYQSLVCVCETVTVTVVPPVLSRETWNLNPPEVRNAQLQFAGWGPRGQQLVSSAHLVTAESCFSRMGWTANAMS